MSAPTTPAFKSVGSSEAGVILGLGMWVDSTPLKIWGRMIGLLEDDDSVSKERGDVIEPGLLLRWEKRHGDGRILTRCRPYEEGPEVIRDGWMHARWDGLLPGELVVEAKSTQKFDPEEGWGEDGSSQIPPIYQAQLAWQMAVLGVPRAELMVMAMWSSEIRRYVGFKRHMGIENALIGKVKAWLEAHVWCYPEVWNPPEETTYDITSARYKDGGKDEKIWVEPRQIEVDLAKAYTVAHAQAVAAEAEKERIKNLLCERIGDAYGVTKIATWAHGKSPDRLDKDKLEAKFPEAFKACLIPGKPNRRFDLKWTDPLAPPKESKSKKNQPKQKET